MNIKHLLVLIATISIAATNPPSFTFLKYRDGGKEEIMGVTLKKGVKEVRFEDGTKGYYIAGKQLEELVKAYNEQK